MNNTLALFCSLVSMTKYCNACLASRIAGSAILASSTRMHVSLPSVRKMFTISDKDCSLSLDVNESTSVFSAADIGVAAAGATTSGFAPIATALVRMERLENTALRIPAQGSVLCKEEEVCSAKKRKCGLQRRGNVLCKEEEVVCSAKMLKRALQRRGSLLCKEEDVCSAKMLKRALQRRGSVLCKEEEVYSAKKRKCALQRIGSVLCKEEEVCSAKMLKCALQRC